MHDCPRFKWPATREDFWRTKIEGNHQRDGLVLKKLTEAGWRVQVVWECALRGRGRRPVHAVLDLCEEFVRDQGEQTAEIAGDW